MEQRDTSQEALFRLFVCFLAIAALGQSTLLAQPGPPLRTGLWVMQRLPRDTNELNKVGARLAANSNLSGVCCYVRWNELEKELGKPDFTMVDKTVALFDRLGMKYELGFAPGWHTPQFIYDEGAQAFSAIMSNPHKYNYGKTFQFPIPWDPIYQREFSKRIVQLGERYSQDPLCVGVVLSCANATSGEMHLHKGPDQLAKWQAMPDYGSKLLDVYKKYIDEWGRAFPRQAISLHMSKVLDLGPSFLERVVEYGLSKYPERFTIQNCQLTGRGENTRSMTFALILEYRDRAHHGFQSLASFDGLGEDRMGSIEVAALNMVHCQGEYWELWPRDGMRPDISGKVLRSWQEAKELGYEAYRKKLISEGKYRPRR
jgi:hypothetical protein